MSTFNTSYVIELKDKFSAVARKAKDSLEGISRKVQKVSEKAVNLGKSFSLKLTAPIGLLGGMALKSAAKLETMQTAFRGILGSGEAASKMVSKLNDFTAKTPFQLEQVSKAAKQLLASGVEEEQITTRLKTLGDISSAANIPLTDMSSIFSKIQNKGKAMTEEILQMSDRGIPIVEVLSEKFGVAKDEVFEMASQSKISARDIDLAFKKMTSKGGFAHDAMINQSKTLSGVYSTMKDNVGLAAAEIGKVFLPLAKKIAIKIIEISQAVKNWVRQNPGLAKLLAIFGGILAVLGPALIVIGKIASGLAAMKVAFLAISAPIAVVSAAIVALIVHWHDLLAAMKMVWDWLKNTWVGKAGGVVVKGVKAVTSTVGKAVGSVKGFLGIEDQKKNDLQRVIQREFGDINANNSSRLDGEIKLTGRTDQVESASIKSSGQPGNVVMNMAGG